MKAPCEIRKMILIALTGCAVAGSVYALTVPHHGYDVDSSIVEACLGCHDGSIAKVVSYCTVGCNRSSSHPVFKRYPPAGKSREFNSLMSVRAQGIQLVNDQVVCISCHTIANQQKFHLAMDNRGSRLCRVCHLK